MSFTKIPVLHLILLIIILIQGLIFTFIIPPFQKPDEMVHFKKSLSISQGYFTCASAKQAHLLPDSYLNLIYNLQAYHPSQSSLLSHPLTLNQLLANKPASIHRSLDTSACSLPFPYYVPSGLTLLISSLLNLPVIIGFFVGRSMNFIISIGFLLVSYSVIPKKFKIIPLLLYCIPTAMMLMTSYNKDWATISFSLLSFSLTLMYLEKPQVKPFLYLSTSLVAVILTRITYAPLLFIPYILKAPVMKIKFRSWLLVLGSLTLLICSYLVFNYIFKANNLLYSPPAPDQAYIYPIKQLQLFTTSPLRFIGVLHLTLSTNATVYYAQALGILGWLDYRLPAYVFILFGGIFSWITQLLHVYISLSQKQTYLMTLLILGSTFFIFFSHYIFSTTVGFPSIQGIQGRYFIPLLPFMLLSLSQLLKYHSRLLLFLTILLITLVSITTTISRYY